MGPRRDVETVSILKIALSILLTSGDESLPAGDESHARALLTPLVHSQPCSIATGLFESDVCYRKNGNHALTESLPPF